MPSIYIIHARLDLVCTFEWISVGDRRCPLQRSLDGFHGYLTPRAVKIFQDLHIDRLRPMEVNANLYGQDYFLPNYAVYPHDPELIEQGACRLRHG